MVSLRLKTLSSLYADDADVPQVQHYRLFLKEHVVFKETNVVALSDQRKIYDEECLKIDNSEKYTLNKQLFESISKSLNEAETKEEIDGVDTKYTLNKAVIWVQHNLHCNKPILA
ncbi:hypothetical protein Goshw_004704 [Gossypium schwendimanii]|uniref:Uncharacterized protein n=1 Tax=Gossypium schwendimanii TaxID=34291 RepID=A0A7J9NAL1_GOSSC|nr:hypothetical protein [Gossypium schwendimanii]